MTADELIISDVTLLRKEIYDHFRYRADATTELIDALASYSEPQSVVKASLQTPFTRGYSSITDVVDNLFRIKANTNPSKEEVQKQKIETANLILATHLKPNNQPSVLLAIDCVSLDRSEAKTLRDRTHNYKPSKIPGNQPIVDGTQYSLVAMIPQKENDLQPNWVLPLDIERVESNENGVMKGCEQLKRLVESQALKDKLCIAVEDSAYSTKDNITRADAHKNLIVIARLRSNRKLRFIPKIASEISNEADLKKRGAPKKYGEEWTTNTSAPPNYTTAFEYYSKKAQKKIKFKVEIWQELLMKPDTGVTRKPISVKVIKIMLLGEDGSLAKGKPLNLLVSGEQKNNLSAELLAQYYLRRFDIEHFFRFGKQKILLGKFQTPDIRHEENFIHLVLLAYVMLFFTNNLATPVLYKWEHNKKETTSNISTPTETQRDYLRIISKIGTPATVSKPRGKSPGRIKGTTIIKRDKQPVVKKNKKEPKKPVNSEKMTS